MLIQRLTGTVPTVLKLSRDSSVRFFWSGFFSGINRPWGMIKVSIFSFPFFGDFNELLENSVLLAANIDAASKISVLR